MTDNRVTITMSDGTTREVDESTPVESPEDIITVAHYAEVHAQPVTAIYEPTREYWTPYEPWMRDVLADDARVSYTVSGDWETGHEVRTTWDGVDSTTHAHRHSNGLRIHPDDAPERPAEDDPDEALAKVAWEAFWTGTDIDAKWELNSERPDWLRVARAAREHIAREQEDALVDSSRQVRAEKAEAERDEAQKEAKFAWTEVARARAERDEWKASFHRAEDEVGTLAVEVGNWKHVANVRGKREVWLSEERNHWKARHAALVADIEAVRVRWHERYMAMPDGHTAKRYAEVIEDFSDELNRTIDRDDERGGQG